MCSWESLLTNWCLDSALNVKTLVVVAYNWEKAVVGSSMLFWNLRKSSFEALMSSAQSAQVPPGDQLSLYLSSAGSVIIILVRRQTGHRPQQILTNMHSYNMWGAGVRCKDSVECWWLGQVHHAAMTANIVLLCDPPRHDRNRDNAGVNCHHTHHLPNPGPGAGTPSAQCWSITRKINKNVRLFLYYLTHTSH